MQRKIDEALSDADDPDAVIDFFENYATNEREYREDNERKRSGESRLVEDLEDQVKQALEKRGGSDTK